MERAEHPICCLYGGRISYQPELLIVYDDDYEGAETIDVAVKGLRCVHYTGDGQDCDYKNDDDHGLLDSEIASTMEE